MKCKHIFTKYKIGKMWNPGGSRTFLDGKALGSNAED